MLLNKHIDYYNQTGFEKLSNDKEFKLIDKLKNMLKIDYKKPIINEQVIKLWVKLLDIVFDDENYIYCQDNLKFVE